MLSCEGYRVAKTPTNAAEVHAAKRALTLRPYVPPSSVPTAMLWATEDVPFYRETANALFVPRRWGKARYGETAWADGDRVVAWDADRGTTFAGALRVLADGTSQPAACEAVLHTLRREGGAILSLYTGAGKTTCALWIAWRLRRKTAVVVHKEPLMEQWCARIGTFLPDARVAILRGAVTRVDPDAEIVVCMLQSLLSSGRTHEGLAEIGLVILDEVHHLAARMFSHVFGKLTRPYTLGLSATVDRKDRLERSLEWFIGPVAFRAEMRAPQVRVRACMWSTNVTITLNRCQQIHFPQLITDLSEEAARNRFLVARVRACVDDPTRTGVLVLSDRRTHCERLRTAVDRPSTLLIGGQKKKKPNNKEEEEEDDEETRLYFGTYGLVSEGVDIPHLDTLVLATPRADVRQSVGRILRGGGGGGHGGANDPWVIDVVDRLGPLYAQFRKRQAFYRHSQFVVAFEEDAAATETTTTTWIEE